MTREQAIEYIKSHPAQFKGASIETVLAKTVSANDPDYFNPTMYVPEQGKTVVKPKPNIVGPSKPAPTPVKAPIYQAPVTQGMFARVSLPSLPIALALGVLALGAGMAIYRVSK